MARRELPGAPLPKDAIEIDRLIDIDMGVFIDDQTLAPIFFAASSIGSQAASSSQLVFPIAVRWSILWVHSRGEANNYVNPEQDSETCRRHNRFGGAAGNPLRGRQFPPSTPKARDGKVPILAITLPAQ